MNGTPDYKFGQIEQKVADISDDFSEWKDTNAKDHHQILTELQCIRTDVRSLWGDVGVLKVKAGWISALVSAIIAISAIIVKTFL